MEKLTSYSPQSEMFWCWEFNYIWFLEVWLLYLLRRETWRLKSLFFNTYKISSQLQYSFLPHTSPNSCNRKQLVPHPFTGNFRLQVSSGKQDTTLLTFSCHGTLILHNSLVGSNLEPHLPIVLGKLQLYLQSCAMQHLPLYIISLFNTQLIAPLTVLWHAASASIIYTAFMFVLFSKDTGLPTDASPVLASVCEFTTYWQTERISVRYSSRWCYRRSFFFSLLFCFV